VYGLVGSFLGSRIGELLAAAHLARGHRSALVPQTVVSTGGQGAGLDSAAAIIGALLNSGGAATPALTGQSPKK
jgi:hypothetical protein